MTGDRLYGREHALSAVRAGIDETRAGRGGLLLVSGEAGIGKSALARQILREAPDAGVTVVWAACREDTGAPPYWPWIQVLRGLSRGLPAAESRFALFDAIAGDLVDAGGRRPVVAVLDDLHWSDEPSLRALAFVAEQVRTAPVLLLGTYREAEAGPLLLDLARGVPVVALDGLAEDDVARLMAGLAGADPDPAVAHDVWRRTGGNPFFVRELSRLIDTRSSNEVPAGVREVLGGRLARLPADAVDLLGTAAVLGGDFTLDALRGTAGRTAEDATAALEQAIRAAVVVRQPAPAGAYRFVHDLFRATLYDGIEPAEQARRHRAAGDALRSRRAAGMEVPPAALAAHYLRAGPSAAVEAVRYSALAAEDAMRRLAYEDACAHGERALDTLAALPPAPGVRLDLLLALGDARHRSGRLPQARTAYLAAAGLARQCADATALATAALGLQRLGARAGTLDPDTGPLLAEAAAALDESHPLLPTVLAAQARVLHHGRLGDASTEPGRIAERAVRLARAGGEPATIATCLLALHDGRWQPGSAGVRLPIVDEMAGWAERAGDREAVGQALQLRATALLELGEPRARTELADYCRFSDDLGHPAARWNALSRRVTLALVDGDLDAATGLLVEAAALGERIGEPDSLGAASTQAFVLTMFGRRPPATAWPQTTFGRAENPMLRAMAHAGRGDREGAAALMAGYRIADTPHSHDPEPLVLGAWMLAEFGPERECREAYRLLLPLKGTHAVVGGCASYQGAIDHHLGRLAAAIGWPDRAAAHFDHAVAMYERLGAPAWAELARASADRPAAVFRREGDTWALGYGGRIVRVPDVKGLHDLATLLANPGRPVHVRDLLGVPAPDGAEPVLDARARAAYRSRLAELEEGDPERAFLVAELSAATGLGGRPRLLGDETDRARKTVTARIRYAVARIRRVHPELAAHLDAHVTTGVHCGYAPGPPVGWRF